jgi:alkanesulfonate monooxygenase SsuD/methylene tetrahydromethanopterin reductase-like flavin-dependent oxidoreductase (luciferase family)
MKRSVTFLAEKAAELGRQAPAAAVVVPVVVETSAARARECFERFMGEHYGLDYERVSRWCVAGSAEGIADELCSLAEHGCTGFVLSSAAREPASELAALATVRELVQRGSQAQATEEGVLNVAT